MKEIITQYGHRIDQVKTQEDLGSAFKNGAVELYQRVFADPPYEEQFTPEEVESYLSLYFLHGILLLAREDSNSVIGFSAAVPLAIEQEIASIAEKYGIDAEKAWYFADLGVDHDHRGKNIARSLITTLLDEIPVDTVLMRTSENNIASQRVNQSVGFEIIDGMEQFVTQARQNGQIEVDKRIFLRKQK